MTQSEEVSDLSAFLREHEPVLSPSHLADGQNVDNWEVVAFLGRGGSAEVYRVRHRESGEFAALKLLVKVTESSVARFRLEARLLADIKDTVFPRFHVFGETENGLLYLVTELLESRSLPNTDAEVADYLIRICSGIARLHAIGYVHRDVKPGNVLFRENGEPVLIDLGLAKPIGQGMVCSNALSVIEGRAVGVGTPGYAAPEQFVGGGISPATDIHALGMLANECFDGNPSPSWQVIIRRATSSISRQRYETVEAFVAAIRHRHRARYLRIALIIAVSVLVTMLAYGYVWQKSTILERIENERQVELERIEHQAMRNVDVDAKEFFDIRK